MVIPADPVPFPDKQALGIDDAAAEQFGDNIDDAAAADAHRLLARVAHNGKGGLHGGFVDGAGLNGAVGGPHAAGDVAALKGRAGRAGAGHHEVAVAENQLAVRADVEKQRQILPRVQIRLQQPTRDVAAQIIGDRGHAVDISADGQSQLRRPDHAGVKKHRRVRALKYEPRVAAEEEVQHRRVAADGHGGDRLRADICRPAAGIDHAAHVRKRQRL